MNIVLPEPSLVALVGPSGCGKSTFARRHFRPTEVLSSDYFRGLLTDDETDQSVSRDVFELLHAIAGKRLARRRLTVIDATSVRPEARKELVALARRHHALLSAVVFNLPREVCEAHDGQRADRRVGPSVVRMQHDLLRRALGALEREEFRPTWVLSTAEEAAAATVERQPLRIDRRDLRGPFDVISDVHGCCDELFELLRLLGYEVADRTDPDGRPGWSVKPPPGRLAVFVGDIVDRGPRIADALRVVMGMVEAGTALCVNGNHDDKLRRKLEGRDLRVTHGLAESLAQLEAEPPAFRDRVRAFLDDLPTHYLLDAGRLVVAHAGIKQEMQGGVSAAVRSFCLYGDTTGASDEYGMPVRRNWAAEYRGPAAVVYGHTPVPNAEWLNRTMNIDTGCAFGGRLSALRYPEKELVSVPARKVYCEPGRPFLPPPEGPAPPAAQQSEPADPRL
jgi:protein phosphatase